MPIQPVGHFARAVRAEEPLDQPRAPGPREEPMKKVLAAIGLMLLAAGSVWFFMDSKNRALEAERDQLNLQKTKLSQDNSRLRGDVAQLLFEADSLANLKRERDALAGERDAIAGERDSLRRAQAETVSHYDALVGKLSQEVDQGHLQIKQYKNMLTVDVA